MISTQRQTGSLACWTTGTHESYAHGHYIAIILYSGLEVHRQHISLIQMCICKVGLQPNSLLQSLEQTDLQINRHCQEMNKHKMTSNSLNCIPTKQINYTCIIHLWSVSNTMALYNKLMEQSPYGHWIVDHHLLLHAKAVSIIRHDYKL